MKTIALIIPYFGQFPNYFDLWLLSVRYNPSIDFYLITDIKTDIMFVDEKSPLNVHIINMSFDELSKKIKSLFDTEISLEHYKKLCDFKPAYGYIFQDYIKTYDFWGFCDMDLIFGNIREFITEEKLERYDKLYALGHLVLVQNTEYMNKMCLLNHNYPVYTYKEAWKEPIASHFDEWRGYSLICEKEQVRCYDKMDFADIDMYRKLFHLVFKGKSSKNKYVFYWYNGELTGITMQPSSNKKDNFEENFLKKDFQKKKFLYVHLQKRRMENKTQNPVQGFWILPNEFIDIKEDIFQKISEKSSIIKESKELEFSQYICRNDYIWYPTAWKVFYSELKDHILYGGLKLRWNLLIKKIKLILKK